MNRVQLFLAFFLFAHLTNAVSIPQKSGLPEIARQSSPLTCQAALSRCIRRIDANRTTECRILPIPEQAIQPVVAPGTFLLTELRTGVYLYNDGTVLSLIVRSSSRLVLIDFPDSAGSNIETGSGTLLTDAIEQVLNGTIPSKIDMIYSHAHLDHIGGSLRVFNFLKMKFGDTPIKVWGTKEAQELVEEHTTNRLTPVTRLITRKGGSLKLGEDLKIKLMIVGGHTQEDVAIFIPRRNGEAGILHLVDIVDPGYSLPFNLALTQNLGNLISTHRTMLRLKFDTLIGGHFQPGTKDDVRMHLEFLEDLIETIQSITITPEQFVEAGIANVQDPNAREFGNAFFGFLTANDLTVDACYRVMIEKWGCRLAALDLFLRSHCSTAFLYVFTSL